MKNVVVIFSVGRGGVRSFDLGVLRVWDISETTEWMHDVGSSSYRSGNLGKVQDGGFRIFTIRRGNCQVMIVKLLGSQVGKMETVDWVSCLGTWVSG